MHAGIWVKWTGTTFQRMPEEPDYFWMNSGGDELRLVVRIIN